jgi:hypothetical protein
VSVLRGSWFVTDETKPCSWDFAEELEKGYKWVNILLAVFSRMEDDN